MRTCRKCRVKKPESEFYKRYSRECGIHTYCKSCFKEYQQNPVYKEKNKAYRQTDAYKASQKAYRQRETYKEKRKEHQSTETYKEAQRSRQSTEAYKEYKREYDKAYYKRKKAESAVTQIKPNI